MAVDPASEEVSPDQLRCHVEGVLRLALRCPYADIRDAAHALLATLEVSRQTDGGTATTAPDERVLILGARPARGGCATANPGARCQGAYRGQHVHVRVRPRQRTGLCAGRRRRRAEAARDLVLRHCTRPDRAGRKR